jgi:hypothetical protein
MTQINSTPCRQTVALFNANSDTVEMVSRMLDASGLVCLIGCHFADLKKGHVNFARYLREHDPDVVIFDISRRTWRTGRSSKRSTTLRRWRDAASS